MNDMVNHAEVAVKRKLDGELLLKKILFIVLYIALALGIFAVCFKTKFVQIGALIPLAVWALAFLTWRYTEIEYEYIVSSGELTLHTIYGNRTRKKNLEIKLKDISRIAPYDDAGRAKLAGMQIKTVFNATKSKDSPNTYYAIFDTPKSGKAVLLFEGDPKALRIMRFYNPLTVIGDNMKS